MAKKVKYRVRYLVGDSAIANKACFKILVRHTDNMRDILPAVMFLNKDHTIWMYAEYPIEDWRLHILIRDSGIQLCQYPV